MTTCPFCGKINEAPLAQPVEAGKPIPQIKLCEHFVLHAYTGNTVWDYLSSELHKNINDLPGVTAYEKDLKAILQQHLTFVDDMAFARSQDARQAAKQAVIGFLTEKGYDVGESLSERCG